MVKKQKKPEINFQERAEWLEKVERVKILQAQGMSYDVITTVTEYPMTEVKRICEDEVIAKAKAEANYISKLPVMKEIIGMGLEQIREFLKELMTDSLKRAFVLNNVTQVAALKNLVVDLEMLVRLTEDKTTQNIGVAHGNVNNYQKTREAVQELKKMDGVFDWPELPAPPEKPHEV